MQELRDAPKDLILIAECAGRHIHALEPTDLPAEELKLGVNKAEGKGIYSMHPGLAHVGLADGSVGQLPDDTDPNGLLRRVQVNSSKKLEA